MTKMDSAPKEKLSRKLREEAGAPLRLSLTEALAHRAGLPRDAFRFLALEESDPLWQAYRDRFAQMEAGAKKIPMKSSDELAMALRRLGAHVQDEEVSVFLGDVDNTGALRMTARVFFLHARGLLEVDGNNVSAATADLADGLLLDLERTGNGVAFEALAWGPRWGAALTAGTGSG